MEATKRELLPNLREKANLLSVLTFWWTVNLFKLGYRKVLDIADLFRPLDQDTSGVLGDRLEKKWIEQLKKSKNPSLVKATILAFWKELSLLALSVILNESFRLGQPMLLGRLLLYFRHDTDTTQKEALLIASIFVVFSFLFAIVFNQYMFSAYHYGMRVRIAMCSIIYRKALKLSRTALGDTAPGKVVNLLSNDVNRFDMVSLYLNMLWVSPLLAIIVGYLLWIEVGFAGIVGVLIIVPTIPLQVFAGKLTAKFRLQAALKTDERVRFMDEIISGVQIIKMYAWEKPFLKLIRAARMLELKYIRRGAFVRAAHMIFALSTTRIALFCTILTMVLMNKEITAAQIFVIVIYYNILAYALTHTFLRSVSESAEVLVSLRRLQKFLMYDEHDDCSRKGKLIKETKAPESVYALTYKDSQKKCVLSIKNATAKWKIPKEMEDKKTSENEEDAADVLLRENLSFVVPTLDNISLNCKEGNLIGIIGEVGAGKTSLLQIILKELPLESGSMECYGKLSYASQEPWVFAASIRQNILFGEEFEKKRYDAVIRACALYHDLKQFKFGDQTIVGERGTLLSGGQKARINLARAVYRQADIYLFDDPLSAVDAPVGRHLFDQVIGPKGCLGTRKITRILVTHQVHYLKDADWLVVLKDGKLENQGSPRDVLSSNAEFSELLKDEIERPKIRRQLSISSTKLNSSRTSLNSDEETDKLLEKKVDDEALSAKVTLESTSKGTVKGSILRNYLKSGANMTILTILIVLTIMIQFTASAFDWFIAYWTTQEELRSIYLQTIKENEVVANKTEYTIKTDGPSILSTEMCAYIPAGLLLLLTLFGLLGTTGFFTMCIKASQKLHDGMFRGIISTSMRFFNMNPSGRILNRFSKDLGSIDEMLPRNMIDSWHIILNIFGTLIVVMVVNPLYLVPIVGLTVVFLFLSKVYLKSSKNTKRLDGITRSPVFTHIGATLTGLPTIRAYGAQKTLIKEFDALQNTHTAAWYMYISLGGGYGFAVDFLLAIFIFIITFSFFLLDTYSLGGQLGLAVSQIMFLATFLQLGVRKAVGVANDLIAVERVIEYRDLAPEVQPEKSQLLSKEWPISGKLEMKNVFYRYAKDAEPVLSNINLSIKHKEKIGIVGRTGAGKSSLIGTIFRLAVVEGDIEIDGVNTEKIMLQSLRSKVSIIPQDPVLFSGTLRRNLDPFEEYDDDALWQSLAEVELKEIANGPKALEADVLAGGSNYSVGQRQLICLARAILRKNKILILDEATANVDPNTDALIQQTIRTRFVNCTVLTVAHRLQTIMDSDRVLVMSDGLVTEFDAPHILLQNNNGHFREMVNATGIQESERLIRIAKDTFEASSKH